MVGLMLVRWAAKVDMARVARANANETVRTSFMEDSGIRMKRDGACPVRGICAGMRTDPIGTQKLGADSSAV